MCRYVIILTLLVAQVHLSTQLDPSTPNNEVLNAINNLQTVFANTLSNILDQKLSEMYSKLNNIERDITFIRGDLDSLEGEVAGLGGRSSASLTASDAARDAVYKLTQNVTQEFTAMQANLEALGEHLNRRINDTTDLIVHLQHDPDLQQTNTSKMLVGIKDSINSIELPITVISNTVQNTSQLLTNINNNTYVLHQKLEEINSTIGDIQDIVERCPDSETNSSVTFLAPGSQCLESLTESSHTFLAPGSQCLTLFNDVERYWSSADAKCKRVGQVLVRPVDAVAMRKYMNERFGDRLYWLAAKGTGSGFRWQQARAGSNDLSSSSPLWWPGHPGSDVTSADCLAMTGWASDIASQPEAPYYVNTCSTTLWTLCEGIME